MKQRRSLAKQLTSVFMTVCLAAGSLGTFPVPVYGEEAQDESVITSSARTDDKSIESTEESNEENVEALLSKGEYAEGQILVLYDRYASMSGEELLGGAEVTDENASSLIRSASVIDVVSAESYVEATGETLEPVITEEELLGASADGEPAEVYSKATEGRVATLFIEDEEKSTRELLTEVLKEPGVLYAQPNYIFHLDTESGSEQVPGNESEEVKSETDMPEATASPAETVDEAGNVTEDAGEAADGDAVPSQSEDEEAQQHTDKIASADQAGEQPYSEPDSIAGSAGAEKAGQTVKKDAALSETEPADSELNAGTLSEEQKGAQEDLVGAVQIPDLTRFQWATVGSSYIPVTDVDPSKLYNVHSPKWNEAGKTNSEGVVAVIDTGVDYTHPDLAGVMYEFSPELQKKLSCGPFRINTGGDGDTKDPMDYNGHGTHCAGIIAGSWNGIGISGMASGCRIMAIKTENEKGDLTNDGVVKAMAFVADAADNGIDVRAVNNSFGGTIAAPCLSVELMELNKRGIVCTYSSGNENACCDIADNTTNQFYRASNSVIVNAATPVYTKCDFSNYGKGSTDVYAPGAAILSSVTTKNNSEKTYFGSLDNTADYYNTEFDSVPDARRSENRDVEVSSERVVGSFSYDADGKAMRVTVDKVEDETSAISFELDLPIGKKNNTDYVSLALYAPGGQYSVQIYREGTKAGGEPDAAKSDYVTIEGYWTVLGISSVPEKLKDGTKFRYYYSEETDEYTIPVQVDITKYGGNFKAGDSIYIDTIGAGSNKQALLPYVYWDGTSMACPYVTAEAMILYSGMERSKSNADKVVKRIKSSVMADAHLKDCTSGGAIDMAVREEKYLPILENAVVNKQDATLILTGENFGRNGSACLALTELKILSWTENKIVAQCPYSMRSGVQLVEVQAPAGIAKGCFLLYAPNAQTDSATPLYETDIPEIPKELLPGTSYVQSVVGLNDCIYLILSDDKNASLECVAGIIRYNLSEKKWEFVTKIPEKLYEFSVACYRGKIIISGVYFKNDDVYFTIFTYSPRTGIWKDLKWEVLGGSVLVNFDDLLLTIGGKVYNESDQSTKASKDIKALNLEERKELVIGKLAAGASHFSYATDQDAIYLSGGLTFKDNKPTKISDQMQKITFDDDAKVHIEKLKPFVFKPKEPYPKEDKITGYQGVYLIRYAGGEPKTTSVGTHVDPDGRTVIDADTYVLSEDEFEPYGKRFSHAITYMTKATEYKGKLYSFGWSRYEGDEYLNFFGRSTTVGKDTAPCWDTFTIKIPKAKEGLTYNGKKQTGVAASEDGYYSIKGNIETKEGTYKATLSLTDPDWCTWEDGTIEDKVVTWKIAASSENAAKPTTPPGSKAALTPKVQDGNKTAANVKTGDTSQPILWLLVGAAAVVIIVVVWRRRKNK